MRPKLDLVLNSVGRTRTDAVEPFVSFKANYIKNG